MDTVLLCLAVATLGVFLIFGVELMVGIRSIRFLRDQPLSLASPAPRVSIIIPARNEERHIEEALRSVLSQDYEDLEIIVIEDRSGGYPRHHRVDLDYVQTGEFRTLLASYRDVKSIKGPMVVRTSASADASDEESGETGPRPAARESEVRVDTLDDLVEFFIAVGKKGVAINRYKGLGEMNPDTLWATTMNPETRTLLQVRAEDHLEADLMFTTLMGDQVEPRRKFIEENALDVKNLDI